MRRFLLPVLSIYLVFLVLPSCSPKIGEASGNLAEKCAPYDMFAFQRSYPDTAFDWQGWQKVMQRIQIQENAASKPTDCGESQASWTQQGPANVAGRCNTIAVKPNDDNTVLAGFAGGGIFKSTDGGVNWKPVFDDNLQLSVGHIVFDPSNPDVVYAGTGDPNVPSIVFNGNGIYKSTDAGETWNYLGLAEVGIISKIVVDPINPNIILVAAMGNPYVRNDQRGIYKSKDGGNQWQKVLFVSNQTGASDLVQSPANPNILFASFWDRIRNNHESIIYGQNAKVFKSSDGGDNWIQMTNGLPSGTMGRTGLAISRQDANKAYVVYVDSLSKPGGLYKTIDGGSSWTPMNIAALGDSYIDFGWYFGKIRVNPTNDEELYFLAVNNYRKPAGSNSWVSYGGGHADSHDLVITPSGRRYWANDGGVYTLEMGQQYWTKCKNLPTTQFYRTNYNPHQPNVYWGGAQDNGVQKGSGGANINSWTSVISADGFNCAFHPTDPNTFWVEIQNGVVHKTTDGGGSWQFGSTAFGSNDRVNWDAPFFISQFNPLKLFGATYRVYTSSGSGGWSPISPDLTDGIIFEPRFHTISCVSESPKLAEKLMAGTSDGNVWRREPTSNWINITGTLPERYVTSVRMSPSESQVLYVTHSGYRDNEQIPHVHRSSNNGMTWDNISGDLPQIPVNDILILPDHQDSILFIGTDAGVYFSKNSGTNWRRLGGDMPVIPVFDLDLNPVKKELIAATFARGIWTIPYDSIFAQQPTVLVNVAGEIKTEIGTGVESVHLGNVASMPNGVFEIQGVPGCSPLVVTPYRNDNPLNGLTTFDLVLISKHILGIEPLGSPFKMIAADANHSNSITTFDVVSLRKLILGIDTVLAGNTSWRFIPSTFSFPNPANPFAAPFPESATTATQASSLSGINFTAIKVGDVNNSAVGSIADNAIERTIGGFNLSVQDVSFEAQSTVEMEVSQLANTIVAAQYSLVFDTKSLNFDHIIPLTNEISADNFGLSKLDQGIITCSYDCPNEGGPLFKIVFKSKEKSKLSQSVAIGNWPTPAMVFYQTGAAFKPVLWDSQPKGMAVAAPNPFGTEGVWLNFVINDNSDQNGETLLEVLDVTGRVLFDKTIRLSDGLHLNAETFPHPGVYYWRLKERKMSGKLVFAP